MVRSVKIVHPGLVYGLLALSGCSDQDAAQIGKVSHKALDKARALTGMAGEQLGISLPPAKVSSEALEISARVQARIKWDQILDGAAIQIHAEAEGIRLTGTVKNEAQRKRAVELAESTAGVTSVQDALEPAVGK
jgi:osmotically-inducible protein OsmY